MTGDILPYTVLHIFCGVLSVGVFRNKFVRRDQRIRINRIKSSNIRRWFILTRNWTSVSSSSISGSWSWGGHTKSKSSLSSGLAIVRVVVTYDSTVLAFTKLGGLSGLQARQKGSLTWIISVYPATDQVIRRRCLPTSSSVPRRKDWYNSSDVHGNNQPRDQGAQTALVLSWCYWKDRSVQLRMYVVLRKNDAQHRFGMRENFCNWWSDGQTVRRNTRPLTDPRG